MINRILLFWENTSEIASIPEPFQSIFLKLFKFGIVGFSGLIIDFGITYLLKDKLKINKYLSNGYGFCLAVISNFILNKVWTFEDKNPAYYNQFFGFVAVALGGLLINQAVLYILHEKYKLKFYLAKFLAIGVVTIWNFGLSNFIIFSQ